METKIYTTKSNANRAGKAFAEANNTTFDVTGNPTGGFMVVVTVFNAEMETAAREKGLSVVCHFDAPAKVGTYTADELAAMDLNGVGEGENGICPHCGIDHNDNGYTFNGDVVNGERLVLTKGTWVCLACNGEWGPVLDFATMFEAYKAAGNSKCKSLRLVAYDYHGNRKNFIADAVGCGVKETTASANWACMKRGEY